jgi:putative membrane protein insertion efficiency factor
MIAFPARMAEGLIWVYQRTVSPALAALNPSCGCRFSPTCSHYAREALRRHGLWAGIALSAWRLLRCGPWHPGGEDSVPATPWPVRRERRRAPSCANVRRAAGAKG